jgi:hypothetical protein
MNEKVISKIITNQIFKVNPETVFKLNNEIILTGKDCSIFQKPIYQIEILE